MTGDKKYRDTYNDLVEKHSYAANLFFPKVQSGPGTGNQSDDEMAFMNYYSLLKYETDPDLQENLRPVALFVLASRTAGTVSAVQLHLRRQLRRRRRCGACRFPQACLEEAADSLVRYPLDRIRWPFRHSHRLDIVTMPGMSFRGGLRGHRRDGKVIPIDERSVEYWNHDPWQLAGDEDGKTLTDGAAFLLPYYMGRYHKFIVE